MPLQTTSAGDRLNQLVVLDPADGYPIGGNLTAPAAGAASGARFLEGAKSANRTIPDPEVTPVTGEDGELYHEYEWTSNATRRFTIEASIEDLFLAGLLQNMPVTGWLGGQYTPEDIASVNVPNVMVIIQRRSKRLSDGGGVWSGEVLFNATLRYLGSAGFTERGAALFRWSATPQPSGYDQLGFTLFDNNGQQKFARVQAFQGLPYPVTVVAIKGNGVVTQFSLDKAPISTTYTDGIVERARASIASVVTAAPFSASFSSAPASGKRGMIWHLFQP